MKLYNILYDWLRSRLRFGSWYVLYPDGKNSRPIRSTVSWTILARSTCLRSTVCGRMKERIRLTI